MNKPFNKKLAAIMFTDIVGYTRIMSADAKQALKILRRNRAIHIKNIDKHRGWLIKEMGDGIMAHFERPIEATFCARDIQLDARSLLCKLRIGVHYGEVTIENNDVFGDGVNIAARLQSIADPGGVFISENVYEAIEKDCDILFDEVGEIILKNVRKPIAAFSIADKDFPKTSRRRKKELMGSEKVEAIAVLPFQSLSGDADQQYLVDGMHDALITELSHIKSLRVISRTSTLRYRESTLSMSQIGEELGVDAVVEATVLKHEDKVRIQVQLIKIIKVEEHLWAQSYDRELKDVLAMYHEVVKDITGKIGAKLTPAESAQLDQADKVNPGAYEAYLKGMFYWGKLRRKDLEKSLEYFSEAVNIDPKFAPAYIGMAAVWGGRTQMGFVNPQVAMPHIYRNMYKSIDLDENLSDSYFFRATLSVWTDWDWEKGYKSFERALKINPNLAIAKAYFAHLLIILGKKDEAIEEIESAIQLDPFNVLFQSLYGMVLNYARRYQRAKAILLNILDENHNHPVAFSTLRSVYFNLGEKDKSYDIFRRSYLEKGELEAAKALQEGYERGGYELALSNVAQLKIDNDDGSYSTPWQIATLYTRAGNKDKAVEYLKKAYDIRDPNMPYLGVDPIFDILKGEPDYLKILEKMNLKSL